MVAVSVPTADAFPKKGATVLLHPSAYALLLGEYALEAVELVASVFPHAQPNTAHPYLFLFQA